MKLWMLAVLVLTAITVLDTAAWPQSIPPAREVERRAACSAIESLSNVRGAESILPLPRAKVHG